MAEWVVKTAQSGKPKYQHLVVFENLHFLHTILKRVSAQVPGHEGYLEPGYLYLKKTMEGALEAYLDETFTYLIP
jgi:hypothetical protein